MIVVCVLKSGRDYDVDYVHSLHAGCARNVPFRCRFLCLTDKSESEFNGKLQVMPLENDWPGWWSKMEVFRPDLFQKGEHVFYMDLDTVIAGPILHILSHSHVFCGLEDFYSTKAKGLATGLMSWYAGTLSDKIYSAAQQYIAKTITPANWKQHWDQLFVKSTLESFGVSPVFFQNLFPGQVVSWKKDCKKGVPADAKIVCFHGKPRPRALVGKNPFIDEKWKVSHGKRDDR